MTGRGNISALTRLFGLMATVCVALGVSLSGAAPAAAAPVTPAAVAQAGWCTFEPPGPGGLFYCYSEDWHRFPNGIRQVFVVGTNRSVYTSWELSPGGSWAPWYSLGGKVAVYNGVADGVVVTGSGQTPTIWVGGTVAGELCSRTRQSNGSWTGWDCN